MVQFRTLIKSCHVSVYDFQVYTLRFMHILKYPAFTTTKNGGNCWVVYSNEMLKRNFFVQLPALGGEGRWNTPESGAPAMQSRVSFGA
jgi:hypothetical protein